VDEYIQSHTLTICRVGAPVLELPVHLGERTWLAEAVDAAVGARLRWQAVRRPELAAVGAGVEAVEQAHPRVQQRAVDRTSHTTGCIYTTEVLIISSHTCFEQRQLLDGQTRLPSSIYNSCSKTDLHVDPLSKVSATWPNATHGQKNAKQPARTEAA